jgi:hypothetical protein
MFLYPLGTMHTLDKFANKVCQPWPIKKPNRRNIYSTVTGFHILIVMLFLLTGCQNAWAPLSFLKPNKTILTEVNPNTIGLHNSAPELFQFKTNSYINLKLKPDVIP